MGEWQAEIFLSGAGPRGTGINEPDTGLYRALCVDSERTVASTGRPGTILKLQIIEGQYKGMVMRQAMYDANATDKKGAQDGMTSTYKASLIGLGHNEDQVKGIIDKTLPMSNKTFEGRQCSVWVEHSNPDKGWDFPDTSIVTPDIAEEIKGGARIPQMKHTKQNPKKVAVGAAPVGALTGGGATLGANPNAGGTPVNGAGNPLPPPPAQGGGGAQLDSLLG